MDLSERVLGKSAVDKFRAKIADAVLEIGGDRFTRADFAYVDCFHYLAAQNLSAILKLEFPKLTGVADLFEHVTPEQLALPRLGVTALAVLGAAFEAKKLGGSKPLEAWVKKHLAKDAAFVSFPSIKHRDEKEHAEERKRLKARKQSRRNQAHRMRVEKFTSKPTNGGV